ncbi:MAG: 6-phosphofructokinase, partial [Atribacterota bacterium]
DFEQLEKALGHPIPKDPHGHPRLAEVPLGDILKREIEARYQERGLKTTIVTKDIGYELRCMDPNPFDIEYTRELGFGAVDFMLSDDYSVDIKEGGALISLLEGKLHPIPFAELMDLESGKKTIRLVDMKSYSYKVGRAFMTVMEKADLANPEMLTRLARAANLEEAVFKTYFANILAI